MPSHSRRPARQGRGQRRQLVWANTDLVIAIAAGGLANVDLLAPLEVVGASILGATVMRTHLVLRFTFAGLNDAFTYGLIVGRRTDLGPGLGPNPSLATDREDDWMWLGRRFAHTDAAALPIQDTWEVDSRAKRKMDELGQAYFLALANGAAAAVNVGVYARTLIALP